MLSACGEGQQPGSQNESIAEADDEQLRVNVEAALFAASDLPSDLMVQVTDGVALISGSLDCEDCGGMRTPGTVDTIQQSLGAVVRAVPGVSDVQYAFTVNNSTSID